VSVRNFKSAQKMQNVVMLYFSQPASSWGDSIMSVTIPVAEAKRLLDHLQAALNGDGKGR